VLKEKKKNTRPLGIKRRERQVRREAVLHWGNFSLRGDLLPLAFLVVIVGGGAPSCKGVLVINVSGSIFHQGRGKPHRLAKGGRKRASSTRGKRKKGGAFVYSTRVASSFERRG
jgi:hypothetical protein